MYTDEGVFVPNFNNPSDTSYDTPYRRHHWEMSRLGITAKRPSTADYCHAVDTGYSIFNRHDIREQQDGSRVCSMCGWVEEPK